MIALIVAWMAAVLLVCAFVRGASLHAAGGHRGHGPRASAPGEQASKAGSALVVLLLVAVLAQGCGPARGPDVAPAPWPTAAEDLDELGARLVAGRVAEARWAGWTREPTRIGDTKGRAPSAAAGALTGPRARGAGHQARPAVAEHHLGDRDGTAGVVARRDGTAPSARASTGGPRPLGSPANANATSSTTSAGERAPEERGQLVTLISVDVPGAERRVDDARAGLFLAGGAP